ncbi:hypothetical protein AM501_02385 [Aneurinibacillus migulanus]|uniref:hypothetical protein n=1 Tax=Aneurinibacillus migulanus TaxID=47500 RepID=UPI0005BB7C1D|nr:hypothetical protein [Aneurinibacillus migulanus]KIV52285.1 hypothetical protein TS64_22725 [Aneurinibacillus migulanus]KPD09726.1 hypothetical protein AM501_02385 [Aneurinibacillus migulanus]
MKKKVFLLVGLIVLAIALSGCGEERTQPVNNNTQTEDQWQKSYRQISISEAERYVELTEKNGKLPTERLKEHSGVIKQQLEKMEGSDKNQFEELASLVEKNNLEEVKAKIKELKK